MFNEILLIIKMLCFVTTDDIYNIYEKKLKLYLIGIILLNSKEIFQNYIYKTNNIVEHIHKSLNDKLNTKYSNFDNLEKAIFLTEKQINSQEYIIDRSNYSSKILLFFINWNKENINKNNKNLLNLEDIRKLNTLSVEGSSTSSFIPLRNFSKKIHLKKMKIKKIMNLMILILLRKKKKMRLIFPNLKEIIIWILITVKLKLMKIIKIY